MTCETCAPWCATSEKQLAFRLENIKLIPDATPYPCHDCGSTDWATSRELIKEGPPKKPSWWERWFGL